MRSATITYLDDLPAFDRFEDAVEFSRWQIAPTRIACYQPHGVLLSEWPPLFDCINNNGDVFRGWRQIDWELLEILWAKHGGFAADLKWWAIVVLRRKLRGYSRESSQRTNA